MKIDPCEGEEIHDAMPRFWPAITIALLILLAWALMGCSSTKDPWRKWQEQNPVEEYHYENGTWRREP